MSSSSSSEEQNARFPASETPAAAGHLHTRRIAPLHVLRVAGLVGCFALTKQRGRLASVATRVNESSLNVEDSSAAQCTEEDEFAERGAPTTIPLIPGQANGTDEAFPSAFKSTRPSCMAMSGPKDDPLFLDMVKPCGYWSSRCDDLPVVKANTDYPGGGSAGEVVSGQDYIVQFDVGLHSAVAQQVLKARLSEIETCVHCPKYEETCLEVIVTGGDMWGDLGMPGIRAGAYDCMGGCGRGCERDGGALDCLKHDVCSAWKSARTGTKAQGFCHDPDCGDEAAQAIFNCWHGWRMLGSVGASGKGPFSTPAACDSTTTGNWNHGGWFTKGRCKLFQGWDKGQGIPDPPPVRALPFFPLQRL